jgi:ATP-dependent DNA helicase RecG
LNKLFRLLKYVKISDFTHKLIKKRCGGNRVIDILFHFPSYFVNRVNDIENFSKDDKLTLLINITDHIIPRRKSSPYKILGHAKNVEISINYFNYNARFLKKLLPIGGVFTVSGDAKKTNDGINMVHPDVIDSPDMLKYYVGIEAVYPLTAHLSNRTVRYVINNLLKQFPFIPEWIPKHITEKYNLVTFRDAVQQLHNPKSMEEYILKKGSAKLRLAIDELLANQIRLRQIRNTVNSQLSSNFYSDDSIISKLNLPFDLTEDQKKCLDDIKSDLISDKPMNRLIQGDVGSGKTVVAFISMLIVIENHFQAVLLAPTEILAMQHYNTIAKLAENLGLKIDIMLSSNRKIRYRQIEQLKSGETQILIGTHAVFEDEIEFHNLGLVVIDEQHRFGVIQRLKLIKKCKYPNVLAMSATPIPRTLLLGFYGDLDVSTIKTKPAGRKPIETIVMNVSKIDELVNRLKYIDSQIYWVCPVIGESENLVDITTRYEYLNTVFCENGIKIMHGKMKPQEKNDIMDDFKKNKFKFLISTTVIEVGVDIPNANVIVIEHAERFGLAQLHQLRGRVGRGNELSYCVLLYHYPVSDIGKQRLQLMKNTNDGFVLRICFHDLESSY